jgi:16S rRNA (uracil1498-N3)-methyltransferase
VTPPVFYLADTDVDVGAECIVIGPEAHHAVVVRRLRPGEVVVLTDGRGTALEATVVVAYRDQLRCLVSARRTEPMAQPQLTVVQAIPKGDRGDLAVELLTEVGVHRILPWSAARSVSHWSGAKAERGQQRWQKVAREAAKQSRRIWWPMIAPMHDSTAVAERIKDADVAYLLDAAAPHSLSALEADGSIAGGGSDVVLIVGPEGGFTNEEAARFANAGATPARLGPTVLRTSTAGVVAAALILSKRWS